MVEAGMMDQRTSPGRAVGPDEQCRGTTASYKSHLVRHRTRNSFSQERDLATTCSSGVRMARSQHLLMVVRVIKKPP